eukprot:g51365.t1
MSFIGCFVTYLQIKFDPQSGCVADERVRYGMKVARVRPLLLLIFLSYAISAFALLFWLPCLSTTDPYLSGPVYFVAVYELCMTTMRMISCDLFASWSFCHCHLFAGENFNAALHWKLVCAWLTFQRIIFLALWLLTSVTGKRWPVEIIISLNLFYIFFNLLAAFFVSYKLYGLQPNSNTAPGQRVARYRRIHARFTAFGTDVWLGMVVIRARQVFNPVYAVDFWNYSYVSYINARSESMVLFASVVVSLMFAYILTHYQDRRAIFSERNRTGQGAEIENLAGEAQTGEKKSPPAPQNAPRKRPKIPRPTQKAPKPPGQPSQSERLATMESFVRSDSGINILSPQGPWRDNRDASPSDLQLNITGSAVGVFAILPRADKTGFQKAMEAYPAREAKHVPSPNKDDGPCQVVNFSIIEETTSDAEVSSEADPKSHISAKAQSHISPVAQSHMPASSDRPNTIVLPVCKGIQAAEDAEDAELHISTEHQSHITVPQVRPNTISLPVRSVIQARASRASRTLSKGVIQKYVNESHSSQSAGVSNRTKWSIQANCGTNSSSSDGSFSSHAQLQNASNII